MSRHQGLPFDDLENAPLESLVRLARYLGVELPPSADRRRAALHIARALKRGTIARRDLPLAEKTK